MYNQSGGRRSVAVGVPNRGGLTGSRKSYPRDLSVAQSLQEPRTLANFMDLFAPGNRSGFLEVNCVQRGHSPHHAQWKHKYVKLEDGVLYCADDKVSPMEQLVTIDEVNSVKTARSLESDTIISLSTPTQCFYLHTKDDAEMKDWLLCFHQTVINLLITEAPSSGATRQTVAGRSQSGDMDEAPRLWSNSEEGGFPSLVRYGGSDLGQQQLGASAALAILPTVDRLHQNGNGNSAAPLLDRSATRDTGAPIAFGLSSPRGVPNRRASAAGAYSLDFDSSSTASPSPTGFLSSSPSRISGGRRTSFNGHTITESTKRVTEPPLEPFLGSVSDHGENNDLTRSDAAVYWAPQQSPQHQYHSQYQNHEHDPLDFNGSGGGFGGSAGTSQGLASLSSSNAPSWSTISSPKASPAAPLAASMNSHKSTTPPPAPAPAPAAKPKSKYVPPHLRHAAGASEAEPEIHHYSSGEESMSPGPRRPSFAAAAPSPLFLSNDDMGMFAMEGMGSAGGSSANGGAGNTGAQLQGSSDHAGVEGTDVHANNAMFGRRADIGCRNAMEDFDVGFPRLAEGESLGFYAVYDGHCGTRVAELASQHLHEYALGHEAMFEEWPHGARMATFAAFDRLENEIVELAKESEVPLRDGSCAIVALVHYPSPDSEDADGVAVANLGDSRAVLFSHHYVSDLSLEHSPARADERARIESIGGWVTVEREMLIEKLHRMDLNDPEIRDRATRRFNYVETSRVNGELAVSRALGDLDYKKPAQDEYRWFFPSNHEAAGQASYVFGDDLVIATPEWNHVQLDDLANEQANSDKQRVAEDPTLAVGPFLIIACDGLWDAITSEEAVQYCRQCTNPQQASDLLVDMAIRMGTSDNITALVIPLARDAFSRPPDYDDHCTF
mmetsp:Transcript_17049/g.33342  ORF Transcript_17049/g.33342 Transcript_17049/m.33342 type:complete len:893 (+) Transcript_17049:580-3258(+)|eukprot:CAMPEP_0171486560 /NCGR_PEP_ID=MMETSP0958-20121227/1158_1 /TAXON_ID=87120 /ORGANISM="Aurantiochytrium limacinum, Strain ATCCMYA-1381" /LENGTH=892 /DNA_ID=CAMNT_0012019453 /DNA_START=552 /DNA_END=3230 /DNA_ORIENTATION=-